MLLRDLATAFKPHAWVNVHSGMEALFLPYDHVARIPEVRLHRLSSDDPEGSL